MSVGWLIAFFVFVLLLVCIEKYRWSKAPVEEIFRLINLPDPQGFYIIVLNSNVIQLGVARKMQEMLNGRGICYLMIRANGKPSDCIAVNPKGNQ